MDGILRPAVATAVFVFVVAGLTVFAALNDKFKAYRAIPLPPPAELEYKAKGMLRELGYTGERLGAERAERLGFVNALFDTHEQLVEGALAVARRIASKAPVAVQATKRMISYTRDHSVAESFDYLNALQPAIFDIEEIRRALKAGGRG